MPSSLFASDYSLSSHNTPTSSSPASVAGSGSSNSVHSKDRSPSVQTTQSNFTNVPPSPAGGRKDIQDLNVADLTINGGLSEKPRLAPPLSPIVSSGYPTPETGRSRRGSPDEIKSLKLGLKKGVQSEFAGFHSSSKMSSPNGHSSGANGSSNGARRPSQAEKRSSGYKTFEACMEGGLGHETKAGTYKVGTEKAYHHFNRALDCFTDALGYKPNNPRAMLARGKILITLSTTYQPPRVALNSLEDSTKLLRKLVDIAPTSVSAREALAQSCALLSGMLVDIDDSVAAADVRTTWEGTVGTLAREALRLLEDVAGDKMDKMRGMQQSEAAENAPSMAETFLALATAAITVSNLAPDLTTVDSHIELAEQALDQASNMATAAAAAKVKSSSSSANLITRVQLASGKSSLDRLRHTFMLGVELDEDDFRSLLTDMSLLATECRERAAKLKGSKAAAASSLAWESVKQLGDARVLYASLLRLVWRKRRPASLASRKASVDSRKLSNKSQTTHRNGSVDVTIKEEDEDEKAVSPIDSKDDVLGGVPVLGKNDAYQQSQASPVSNGRLDHVEPKSAVNAIRQSHGLVDIPGRKDSRASRKGSNLDAMPEGQAVSAFTREGAPRHSISSRRGSWLPENGVNTTAKNRTRRMSSMTAPLVGSDGVTAWNRKASVIALSENGDDATAVTSAELAQTAYLLLDGATTQYKLALTLLSTADLPSVHLAKAKSETLSAIASSALFMASLSRRVPAAAEKKTSLLVTAEVYSTWAAREVGWSFLIEGTKEALAADRRTNSWKADEVGKTAVMLLIRTWWFRAVTTDSVDVDTKISAKDAVEVVVRRMKDKEGVNDGDLLRMKSNLIKIEGQLDQAEELFWRSVSRILRGGNGFVMG